MAISIKVCNGGTCGGKGGTALLRDIEELCGLRVDCAPRGCMGKCAKGPNVEVVEQTGKSKISTGIKNFGKVEAFLTGLDALELAPSKLDLDVGKLKYKVRRSADATERSKRIEEGFQLLGGEEAAQSQQPLNAATLLVLRSKELLKLDATKALQDAELAMRLWADWPQAVLAQGAVLEQLGRLPEAVTALERAMKMRRGVDMQKSSGQIQRLRRKAAQAEPPAAKVEAVEDAAGAAAAEPAASTVAPVEAKPQPDVVAEATAAKVEPAAAKEDPAARYGEVEPWATPTHGLHLGLYEEFGGHKLTEFVNGFYDKMAEDPNLGRFFARFTMVNLKARTVDYMAAQWGGPEYHGPDLFTAHATMHLTDNQWGIMTKCIHWKLKQMGIGTAMKKRVMAQIDEMYKPIIDPEGEFIAWLKKKQKEAQDLIMQGDDMIDPSGMGFLIPKAKLEAWKADEARKKNRREQMALLKAKREQEAAAAKAPKAAPKAATKASAAENPTAKKPADGPKKVVEKAVAKASPKRDASRPSSKPPAVPKKAAEVHAAEAHSADSLPTTASSDATLRGAYLTSSGESLAAPPSWCLAPEEPAAQPPSSATPRFFTLAL